MVHLLFMADTPSKHLFERPCPKNPTVNQGKFHWLSQTTEEAEPSYLAPHGFYFDLQQFLSQPPDKLFAAPRRMLAVPVP
jgi:hypothetical protein